MAKKVSINAENAETNVEDGLEATGSEPAKADRKKRKRAAKPAKKTGLEAAAERLMAESGWLERRRSVLEQLVKIANGGDERADPTQFRALNLILELMEKAENEAREAFQPTEESIREAIEILNKYVT